MSYDLLIASQCWGDIIRFNKDTIFKDFPDDLVQVDNGSCRGINLLKLLDLFSFSDLLHFVEIYQKLSKRRNAKEIIKYSIDFCRKVSLTIEVRTLIEYLADLSFTENKNKDFYLTLACYQKRNT